MTGEFVMSFLKTCWEEGLSKEAAAELLQRQSVIHTGGQSPAWREGYEKVASMVPGGLLPLARPGYFEKSAAGGLRRSGKAVLDFFGGLKDTAVDSAKALRTGTGRVNTGLAKSKVVRKNPVAVGLAGAGLGGAALYGGSKLLSAPAGGEYTVPSMAPGGYNPEESAKARDGLVASDSVGLYEHNKKYFGEEDRKRELQQAVDTHAVNSGAAQVELQRMNSDHASATAQRKKYFNRLDGEANASESKLKEIEAYKNKMQDHKTSLLYAPYRGYLRLTGRKPNDVYNDEIAKSEGQASDAATANYRINEQRRKLQAGLIGGAAKSRTPQEMQNDFFPAYN